MRGDVNTEMLMPSVFDIRTERNLSLELFGVQCAAQVADWSGEVQVSVIGVDESIRVHPRPVCTADQPVVPLQCGAKCTAAAAPLHYRGLRAARTEPPRPGDGPEGNTVTLGKKKTKKTTFMSI